MSSTSFVSQFTASSEIIMSYRVETDMTTGHKYIVDVKRRRSICSIEGCLSRAQRDTLCAKHLQVYGRRTADEKMVKTTRVRQSLRAKRRAMMRKRAHTRQLESMLCPSQHQFTHVSSTVETHLSSEHNGDANSKSSVEYDYTNPSPTPVTGHPDHRHVCIATIYLQEAQWHQLELFIKHFSSYASLSHNLNVNASTTHLLVDDSTTPLRCVFSKKIFQAVARRVLVVSIRWIEECRLRNDIVDETPFEIHGDSTMSTMHLARRFPPAPLFASTVAFVVDCASFQRTLTRNELVELAELSGAIVFHSEQSPLSMNPCKLLLILADATADQCRLQSQYQSWHSRTKFLTPGYLLKSIIYQKPQPFEDFEL